MKSFVILSALIAASLAGNDNPKDRRGSGYHKEFPEGGWEAAGTSYYVASNTCYQFNMSIVGNIFVWNTTSETVDGVKEHTFYEDGQGQCLD